MKICITLLTAIILFHLNSFSQNWKWAHKIDTYTGKVSVKCDKYGNAFIYGQIMPPAVFHHHSGIHTENNIRAFVSKYDSEGNMVWLSGGTGAYTNMDGYDVDDEGSSYQTGSFKGLVTFGVAHDTLKNQSFDNGYDAFLVKLDQQGKCIYFNVGGDTCNDNGVTINTLKDGSLIQFELDELSCYNMGATIKVNLKKLHGSNGSVLDTFKVITGADVVNFAATHDKGFIAFGTLSSEAHFFGISSSMTLSPANQNIYDAFLVKFDSLGELSWGKTIKNGSFISGFSVSENDQLIVQMKPSETASIGSQTITPGSLVLLKLDAGGNYLKHLTIHTPLSASAHQTDSKNNIYLHVKTGYSLAIGSDTIIWNPSTPGNLVAIVKLDSNFNYEWSEYYTGYSNQIGRIAASDSTIYLALSHDGVYYINVNGQTFVSDATSNIGQALFIAALRTNNNAVNLNTNEISNKLRVYPNPNEGEFTVKCDEPLNSINIFNELGICVIKINSIESPFKKLDLKSLSHGVYVMELHGQHFVEYRKIIVK